MPDGKRTSRFLRKGFSEHQRLNEMRRDFERAGTVVAELLRSGVDKDAQLLLLLSPLVEVAWADGRITARESEAVLQLAGYYGIAGDEDIYCELMETLLTRPTETATARNWFRFNRFLSALNEFEFEIVSEAITVQARFVAEHSSNNLIGFLRGDGINRDEEAVLKKISNELRKARIDRDKVSAEKRDNLVSLSVRPSWSGRSSVKRVADLAA